MATKKKMLQAAAGVGGDVGAWDLSYAYYDDALAWDVSTSSYKAQFSVAAQELAPRGVFFKPDGLKMYIAGSTGDEVNEYSLSTAWLVSTASFVRTFSVVAQEQIVTNLFFKPDGTKMYIVGSSSDRVHEYDLSTAWNISTASFLQSFLVTTQDTVPEAIFFKPDGTKMYIAGNNGDEVNEYDLSTAWDISTAVFLQLFSLALYGSSPQGLSFKADGTKMFLAQLDGTYEGVVEYNLSTAWDVSTASYSKNFVTTATVTSPTGLFFNPDGTNLYITDYSTDLIYQYTLGGFSVAAQESQPRGMCFDTDGSRMYVVGTLEDEIKEYSLSTNYDLSTASYVRGFYIGSSEQSPQGIFFKPDGTTVYACGSTTDSVHQWSLSTAWDVSTMSYVQSLGVGSQDATPAEVFFKPDGTVMYIAGQASVSVFAYTLSTAWDISTASYSTSFSLSGQIVSITGLFFKDDGTKMYTIGYSSSDINEYDLSTAWDISTASFVQEFNLPNLPMSAVFNNDGTKLFELSWSTDRIFTYSLGVQE